MARTKGAIDKRPRRVHHKPKTSPKKTESPAPDQTTPATVNPEFLATIDAEMALNEPQARPEGSGSSPADQSPLPPAAASEPPLTKDAWEGVLRVPFRVLALATSAPGVADVGDRRAKDLARPSYPIFEYYAKEYLGMHPDDPLSLAWAATGLVLADIGADVIVAINQARAIRAREAAAAPVSDGPINQAA